MPNTITLGTAEKMIEAAIRAAATGGASTLPAIMLRGSPGIGKSTIARSIADRLGIGFTDVRLAQLERVDFCGLPSVNDGVTQWNVPGFWPRDPKSHGIIMLDEITSAPADVQVAAYQLVLDRQISNSNYKLPDGWFVLAAGNLATDRAVVKSMSSALANRFMHIDVHADIEDWILWAARAGIHPSITGFLKFRPNLLFSMEKQDLERGWPSPRAWERVSNILPIYGNDEAALTTAVYGLVGAGAGVEFLAFHKSAVKFADVVKILTDPNATITVPTKIDERCAFCTALVYHVWTGDTAEDARRVEGLYRVLNVLPPDFTAMTVKMAIEGNKSRSKLEAIKAFTMSPSYAAFAAHHAAAFSQMDTNLSV